MKPNPQKATPGGNLASANKSNLYATDCIAPAKPHQAVVANTIAKLRLARHHVHLGQNRDFLVSKYGMTRYCQTFDELQAFAKKLGVQS